MYNNIEAMRKELTSNYAKHNNIEDGYIEIFQVYAYGNTQEEIIFNRTNQLAIGQHLDALLDDAKKVLLVGDDIYVNLDYVEVAEAVFDVYQSLADYPHFDDELYSNAMHEAYEECLADYIQFHDIELTDDQLIALGNLVFEHEFYHHGEIWIDEGRFSEYVQTVKAIAV